MNVFIRQADNGFEWFATSAEAIQPEYHHGNVDDLAEYYQAHHQVKNWVLVAPALNVASKRLEFSEKEKKHIKKAIPFLLEDDMLSDADELHVLTSKPESTSIAVVAIEKDVLESWLEQLAEKGIYPTHCLPEMNLLCDRTSDWQLFYRNDQFMFCSDAQVSLAFEQEHFAIAVQLLTNDFSDIPVSIELIADNEDALEQAAKYIPESIMHIVEPKTIDYGQMLQMKFPETAKTWNFLIGPYAYAKDYLSAIRPWKWVIALFIVTFALQLGMFFADFMSLKNEFKQLELAKQELAREVIPKGKIVDPQSQVERVLSSLEGTAGATGFIKGIETLGEQMKSNGVIAINAINYDDQQSEYRLDFVVPDYNALQSIINSLNDQGYAASIQNSNAQDEYLRARLKVTI